MKRYFAFFLVCIFLLLISACQKVICTKKGETTMENSITKIDALTPLKPLPADVLPEMKKNKEILLAILPIDDDMALEFAKSLYRFYMPEFSEAKVVLQDDIYYKIQATDKSNNIYLVSLSIYGGINAIWKLDENGDEVMIYNPLSELQP